MLYGRWVILIYWILGIADQEYYAREAPAFAVLAVPSQAAVSSSTDITERTSSSLAHLRRNCLSYTSGTVG